VQQNAGNDYAWFRLAEMYLIRAEALNEQSSEVGRAHGAQHRAGPHGPVARCWQGHHADIILRERLFEFTAEAKRRQDLIRHGKYTLPWEFKPGPIADSHVLMPIPQTQIDANALICQNPGYGTATCP